MKGVDESHEILTTAAGLIQTCFPIIVTPLRAREDRSGVTIYTKKEGSVNLPNDLLYYIDPTN